MKLGLPVPVGGEIRPAYAYRISPGPESQDGQSGRVRWVPPTSKETRSSPTSGPASQVSKVTTLWSWIPPCVSMHCSFTRTQLERKKQSAVTHSLSLLSVFCICMLNAHVVALLRSPGGERHAKKDRKMIAMVVIPRHFVCRFGGVLSPPCMSRS